MILYLEKLKEVKIPPDNSVLLINLAGNPDENSITSHQPIIFTPGVLSKFLFNENLKDGHLSKTIVYNDSDKAEFKIFSSMLSLFPKTLENLNTEDIEQLKGFIRECYEKYSEFLSQKNKENYLKFLDIINRKKFGDFSNFSEFWHSILSEYLESFGYKVNFTVNYVSQISETPEFKDFFDFICSNYESFFELYNEGVEIFRKNIGFYPIKKLEKGELPFWGINKNERKTMHLDNISKDFQIRPKAVAWAIYRRYFLYNPKTDILGIGSTYYNFVCDYVATNLLKLPIPKTTVISITIPLNKTANMEEDNIKTKIEKLDKIKSILNAFKYSIYQNPERLNKILDNLLKNTEEKITLINLQDLKKLTNKIDLIIDKSLVKQKEKLLEQINDKNNRKIKKELTQKINQINQQIIEPIKEYLEELNRNVEIIELHVEKLIENYKEVDTRDYPYFLISPQEILDKIYQKT